MLFPVFFWKKENPGFSRSPVSAGSFFRKAQLILFLDKYSKMLYSFCVHVISLKAIKDFAAGHPESLSPLMGWYKAIAKGSFVNFPDLKRSFVSVDYVDGFYVFDIGGNKFRLIAAIHFNTQTTFVRNILTHQEYDRGGWKK